MYTAIQLMQHTDAANRRREEHADRNDYESSMLKGILTKAEAEDRVRQGKELMEISILGESSEGFGISKAAFFTDDYGFGTDVLPKGWGPCSSKLGYHAKPRPGLESGLVRTVDDWMIVHFHAETKLIQSIDELVEYLNSQIN